MNFMTKILIAAFTLACVWHFTFAQEDAVDTLKLDRYGGWQG